MPERLDRGPWPDCRKCQHSRYVAALSPAARQTKTIVEGRGGEYVGVWVYVRDTVRVRRHDTSALFVIESGHLESASISNDFDAGESFEEGWMERKLFFDDIEFDIFRFAFHSISRNCNSSWMFHEEEINLDTRRWRLDLINRSMRDIYERVIIGKEIRGWIKSVYEFGK